MSLHPLALAFWSSSISRFDIDGRGQIDQKDLVKVIQDIGEGQSYDQIRSTIKAVDINATGKVEVDEFLEVNKAKSRDPLIRQQGTKKKTNRVVCLVIGHKKKGTQRSTPISLLSLLLKRR